MFKYAALSKFVQKMVNFEHWSKIFEISQILMLHLNENEAYQADL